MIRRLLKEAFTGNPRTWIGLPPTHDCIYVGVKWLAEDKRFLADVERAILAASERKQATP